MSEENSIEEINIEDANEEIDVETKDAFVTSIISQSDTETKTGGDESTAKAETSTESPKPTPVILTVAKSSPQPEPVKVEEDDEDDFEDESLGERLYALGEMFPACVRNLSWSLGTGSVSLTKSLYSFSRSALWVFTTSAIFLAAAPVIQNELDQIEEMNRAQQRQILLGPGALSNSPAMHHT